MADLRIVDAPLIPKVDITGSEKIPTGGSGNYSISLDGIAEYTQESLDLAYKTDVQTSENGVKALIKQHTDNLSNPHVVTKDQVGLGNVDNTADADKPMSNLTQSVITTLDQKKADKASVYLKTETYNKNEVDSALANKPNSNTVYTKTETNNLLNGKVSSVNGKTGTAITLTRNDLGISSDEVMQQWLKEARFVTDESGLTQQQVNNNLKPLLPYLSTFVTPEMFGAVANKWEFDNTDALNAAFATGKDVYSTPDKIYTCNKNLRTQGQRCIGGWKIRSSKPVVGTPNWTNTSNTNPSPCDFKHLQGVYCAYAYDLAEFFAIRDLGYNTLLHYGGMHISGHDDDGNVQNVLDNAKTAGLQVFLGTQNDLEGMTLADYVNTYKNHPSVLGFIIADEPTHNGISVAQQKIKINQMKALTNKPLACSDFTFDAFTEVLADGYDYIFGDIYNDLDATKQQTLYKMRAWLGLTSKRHPNAKVLPTVMGFKYGTGVPLTDIIETSKIFAKACGGNFACFGWDVIGETSISNSIRDTYGLQDLSREICAYKTNVYQIPKCYAWGAVSGLTSQVNYGLNDVISNYVRSDPYTVGLYEGINSYPAQMNGAEAEGERTTPYISTGQAISGLWFKHTFGAYISDIKMKKKNHFTVQSGMLAKGAADVILTVRGSSVGGYGLGSVLAELPKSGEVATVVFDNNGINDTFCIKYDCSVDPQFYRTFVRGVYITSDW